MRSGSDGAREAPPSVRTGPMISARLLASAALTIFVVAQTVMIRFSRNADGQLPYNPAAATFFNELIKLIVATILWWVNDKDKEYNGLDGVNVITFTLFSIPGLIYAIQNTLVFYALVYLEAPTFQVVASLKIVTTAVLFRIVLQKILTTVQWIALLQLFLSMVITKMGALVGGKANDRTDLFIGASILMINSWLSAVSGITNEWLVKHQDSRAPLMMKSIQLYFWGTAINLIAWIVTDTHGVSLSEQGLTPLVWCIIVNNAAVGLSVSFIMKYADNIVKCFSTAAAVFISAILSSILFNFSLDLPFVVGLFVYSSAFFLYFGGHNSILKSAGFHDGEAWLCIVSSSGNPDSNPPDGNNSQRTSPVHLTLLSAKAKKDDNYCQKGNEDLEAQASASLVSSSDTKKAMDTEEVRVLQDDCTNPNHSKRKEIAQHPFKKAEMKFSSTKNNKIDDADASSNLNGINSHMEETPLKRGVRQDPISVNNSNIIRNTDTPDDLQWKRENHCYVRKETKNKIPRNGGQFRRIRSSGYLDKKDINCAVPPSKNLQTKGKVGKEGFEFNNDTSYNNVLKEVQRRFSNFYYQSHYV
mmetsp:Transcript_33222/g.80675  ORF Transcript_33222/g.80675 Transcript_33222/m.80675 type:complete len:586 (-) Transcript_33222:129-1886(-)